MQRDLWRGRLGVMGAVGALLVVSLLSGCPGTLDPDLLNLASKMGGNNGHASGGNGSGGNGSGGNGNSGGSTGSGGSNASGGSSGMGGNTANCTAGMDGASVITTYCAVAGCHDTASASLSGAGLDLTINSGIASRLVDVVSPGDTGALSACAGNTEPYLKSGSSPATGLLIQKIQSSPSCSPSESPPCCGTPMPYPGAVFLTSQEQTCVIQWATTLTSP